MGLNMWGWLPLLASLVTTGQCAAAPEGVKVFAFSFFDTARDAATPGYYQVITTASQSAASRLKFSALGVSEYALLRTSNSWTYSHRSNTAGHEAPEGVVSQYGAIVVTEDTDDVYVGHILRGSVDFFRALPLTKGSQEYYIPSYKSVTGAAYFSVSAAAPTCVELYTVAGGVFTPYTSFNLDAGQVYTETSTSDITGLNIQSSQPVGVQSGHECAQVTDGTQFCDHLMEQIPPVKQWGRKCIVPPVLGRNPSGGYMLRILASKDDTAITIPYQAGLVSMGAPNGCVCDGGALRTMTFDQCTQPCLISRGDFLEVKVTDASVGIMIQCSNPCLVTQYTMSFQIVSSEPLDPDPYTMIITPTDHYGKTISFSTPEFVTISGSTEVFVAYTNFLSIVLPTASKDGLQYNGNPVTQGGQVLGDYTVLTLSDVAHGYHTLYHTDPTVNISGFAYGHSPKIANRDEISTTSYGVPLTYTITGETIAGNWAEDIKLPPGVIDEDKTTAAPRVCSRTNTQQLSSQFIVKSSAAQSVASSCNVYMNQPRLDAMKDLINDAICQEVICPGVTDNIFVISLQQVSSDQSETTVNIKVTLSVDLDVEISSMLQCRVHVTNFLQRLQHWAPVLPSSELTQCNDVITSLQKQTALWICPV